MRFFLLKKIFYSQFKYMAPFSLVYNWIYFWGRHFLICASKLLVSTNIIAVNEEQEIGCFSLIFSAKQQFRSRNSRNKAWIIRRLSNMSSTNLDRMKIFCRTPVLNYFDLSGLFLGILRSNLIIIFQYLKKGWVIVVKWKFHML